MPQAALFDVDGTLVDSVDLHALAWQEALAEFGHEATFEQVGTRRQDDAPQFHRTI
jgi:beta-phosphoglucomutase-like phosphatase (HAD superfamily)